MTRTKQVPFLAGETAPRSRSVACLQGVYLAAVRKYLKINKRARSPRRGAVVQHTCAAVDERGSKGPTEDGEREEKDKPRPKRDRKRDREGKTSLSIRK